MVAAFRDVSRGLIADATLVGVIGQFQTPLEAATFFIGLKYTDPCETARRPEGRSSFCEELVLGGYCAAALGASARTLHEHNRILARGLCSALGRAQSLGDALRLAGVPDEFFSHYRIFGDPGAPLIGAEHAEDAAKQVFAPAPDYLLKSS